MTTLSTISHPKLSSSIVQELQRKNITTLIEFVLEDSEKLTTITGLLHKDIVELKKIISDRYGGTVKNACDVLKSERKNIVSTSITILDDLLKNGLHPGQIYELCGASSSGKTQLCFTIAANVARDGLVRYIDTKKDFSSSRMEEILRAKCCNTQVVEEAMERIKVCCVQSLRQLIRVLLWLKVNLRKEEEEGLRTKIIIIDSLPAIIFKSSNDQRFKDHVAIPLNRVANICRFIAKEFSLPIITVNLVTRWNSLDPNQDNNVNGNIYKPALGKYWLSIPNTRLSMEKLPFGKRKISVWKSYQLEADLACILNLSDAGMT